MASLQCFWHIQHEFIEGERSILARDDHQLTSAAGYAGKFFFFKTAHSISFQLEYL
jgi:hypothetical protein